MTRQDTDDNQSEARLRCAFLLSSRLNINTYTISYIYYLYLHLNLFIICIRAISYGSRIAGCNCVAPADVGQLQLKLQHNLLPLYTTYYSDNCK